MCSQYEVLKFGLLPITLGKFQEESVLDILIGRESETVYSMKLMKKFELRSTLYSRSQISSNKSCYTLKLIVFI